MNSAMQKNTSTHVTAARGRLTARALARASRAAGNKDRALRDAAAIVRMIVRKYRPLRVYQWGSLIGPGFFADYSDIDIAVEGVTDAQLFFAMLGDAQSMTKFPLDIVQMEKIAAEYADDIRRHGRLVYERE